MQATCDEISNALGVYFKEYRITPDKLLEVIEEKKKREREG